MAIPNLDQVGRTEQDGWNFPEETVLIKNFSMPLDDRNPAGAKKRIETRLMYLKGGAWRGYSYEWNDGETDAQLLTTGKTRPFTRIGRDGNSYNYNWNYPSRSDCFSCHTQAANYVLGLTTAQMNFDFTYPASGVKDNQLRTLDFLSIFDERISSNISDLAKMPDHGDLTATFQNRARAYLASNCSMCHRPGSTGGTMDLRWENTNAALNAIGVFPSSGDLGLPDARIINSGKPESSVLLSRMRATNANRMPRIGSTLVDEDGSKLIEDWIKQLSANQADGWIVR